MRTVGLYATDGAFICHVEIPGEYSPRVLRVGERVFVCADVLFAQYRESPSVVLTEQDFRNALGSQQAPVGIAATAAHT